MSRVLYLPISRILVRESTEKTLSSRIVTQCALIYDKNGVYLLSLNCINHFTTIFERGRELYEAQIESAQ